MTNYFEYYAFCLWKSQSVWEAIGMYGRFRNALTGAIFTSTGSDSTKICMFFKSRWPVFCRNIIHVCLCVCIYVHFHSSNIVSEQCQTLNWLFNQANIEMPHWHFWHLATWVVGWIQSRISFQWWGAYSFTPTLNHLNISIFWQLQTSENKIEMIGSLNWNLE